jgi:AcrR family transcriptional regulator
MVIDCSINQEATPVEERSTGGPAPASIGSMPRLIDTGTRTDELAHTLARLIAEEGLVAPSSRRVAAELKLSIASLYHHYESRERLLRVLGYRIGLALVEAVEDEVRLGGIGALLRADEDGLMLTRAWLGVVELGRCDEHVGNSVAAVQRRERSSLMLITGERDPSSTRIEALQAQVHGLRGATTRYCEPLDVEAARELLAAAAARSASTIASGSSAE